jgi:hypothetical protein
MTDKLHAAADLSLQKLLQVYNEQMTWRISGTQICSSALPPEARPSNKKFSTGRSKLALKIKQQSIANRSFPFVSITV